MKPKKVRRKWFTVIGVCGCGCEDTWTYELKGIDAADVARQGLRLPSLRGGTIVAVIKGSVYIEALNVQEINRREAV